MKYEIRDQRVPSHIPTWTGLGFRVQGLGFRFHGLGFKVQGLGFRAGVFTIQLRGPLGVYVATWTSRPATASIGGPSMRAGNIALSQLEGRLVAKHRLDGILLRKRDHTQPGRDRGL